jgi:hypothetical protein
MKPVRETKICPSDCTSFYEKFIVRPQDWTGTIKSRFLCVLASAVSFNVDIHFHALLFILP